MADRRSGDVKLLGGGLERAAARGKLERLQREQCPRRQVAGTTLGQNASAGSAIRVEAPALI